MKRLRATVHGRVQAVGFRDFVQRHASQRGLTGVVRNGDDSRTVEVIAEGDEAALESFVRALYDGPRMARVDRVDASYADATGAYRRFTVEF